MSRGLSPTEPEQWTKLGDSYAAMGWISQSHECWGQAARLGGPWGGGPRNGDMRAQLPQRPCPWVLGGAHRLRELWSRQGAAWGRCAGGGSQQR